MEFMVKVETGDPLLNGPIEPPLGARINRQDQRSADEPTHIPLPAVAAEH